jgi:hypothetical protein
LDLTSDIGLDLTSDIGLDLASNLVLDLASDLVLDLASDLVLDLASDIGLDLAPDLPLGKRRLRNGFQDRACSGVRGTRLTAVTIALMDGAAVVVRMAAHLAANSGGQDS